MQNLRPAIVVTGASSGIGRELARVAAKDGECLLLVGRSASALAEVVAELKAANCEADAIAVDLTDRNAGEQIETALAERDLYCDVLVNCAGRGALGEFVSLDAQDQMKVLEINVRALTDLTHRFLPGMVKRGRGGLLNVGSLAGYLPGPKMAVYFASKAYVRSFSAALSAELADTSVTVTCLAPGQVRTPFHQRAGSPQARLFTLPTIDARRVAESGWRGFRAGRREVIPGRSSRMFAMIAKVLPQALIARVIMALYCKA